MISLSDLSPRCFLNVCVSLQVLEPRFNVEALALLLNIPPNKTLLRRHLATHFHLLIGSEAQRLKQDCLENPDYTVLTATAKVKVAARPPRHKQTSVTVTVVTAASLSVIILDRIKAVCPPAASLQDTEVIVGQSADTLRVI